MAVELPFGGFVWEKVAKPDTDTETSAQNVCSKVQWKHFYEILRMTKPMQRWLLVHIRSNSSIMPPVEEMFSGSSNSFWQVNLLVFLISQEILEQWTEKIYFRNKESYKLEIIPAEVFAETHPAVHKSTYGPCWFGRRHFSGLSVVFWLNITLFNVSYTLSKMSMCFQC